MTHNARHQPRPKAVGCMAKLGSSRDTHGIVDVRHSRMVLVTERQPHKPVVQHPRERSNKICTAGNVQNRRISRMMHVPDPATREDRVETSRRKYSGKRYLCERILEREEQLAVDSVNGRPSRAT